MLYDINDSDPFMHLKKKKMYKSIAFMSHVQQIVKRPVKDLIMCAFLSWSEVLLGAHAIRETLKYSGWYDVFKQKGIIIY